MTAQRRELSFAGIRKIMQPGRIHAGSSGLGENVPTVGLFRETMNHEQKQLAVINPSQLMQISSDVASVCGEIVRRTALSIKGRQYVRVEGWQAIASAHGCIAGCREVERVDGGVRALAELRRISDGALLAVAEGFVGKDELVWYGGQDKGGKTWPPAPPIRYPGDGADESDQPRLQIGIRARSGSHRGESVDYAGGRDRFPAGRG